MTKVEIRSQTDTSQLQSFLRSLATEDDGFSPNWFLVWTMFGDVKRSHWFQTIASVEAFVGTITTGNVYFALGLSPTDNGADRRCKASEISALLGFATDIDVASSVHTKAGLPPTMAEAHRILSDEYPPTFTVDTGHGLQAHWLFKEPLVIESEDERQNLAALSQRVHNWNAGRAAKLSYVLDSCYSLDHLFRLPGTYNRKVDNDPKPVKVIHASRKRYEPAEMSEILDLAGVPEREVIKVDSEGRVEFGDLRVNPRPEFTPALKCKYDAMMLLPDFERTWNCTKRMPADNSWSGKAQGIANVLASADFTAQEIIDLLVINERQFGHKFKKASKRRTRPLSWYVHQTDPTMGTVSRALNSARAQKAKDQDREQKAADKQAKDDAEQAAKVFRAKLTTVTTDEAREVIADRYGIQVERLVQIGSGADPAFRLELKGDRRVEFPTLSAFTSFYKFSQHLWLGADIMLPAKYAKHWSIVATALSRLKIVEDTGGGTPEMILGDLREWLVNYRRNGFFEDQTTIRKEDFKPASSYRSGKLTADDVPRDFAGVLWVKDQEEFLVGVRLMAIRWSTNRSFHAVVWPQRGDDAYVAFKIRPFRAYLVKQEFRGNVEAITTVLSDAGLAYRKTTTVAEILRDAAEGATCNPADNIHIHRVWRGLLWELAPDQATDDLDIAATVRRRAAARRRAEMVQ